MKTEKGKYYLQKYWSYEKKIWLDNYIYSECLRECNPEVCVTIAKSLEEAKQVITEKRKACRIFDPWYEFKRSQKLGNQSEGEASV